MMAQACNSGGGGRRIRHSKTSSGLHKVQGKPVPHKTLRYARPTSQTQYKLVKITKIRAGEMAQWLRALPALPKVLSSIPSNHMLTTICNENWYPLLASRGTAHTCGIAGLASKMLIYLFFFKRRNYL